MIYTLTMNPAIDKTVEVDKLIVHGLNRIQTISMVAGGKGINVSKMINHLHEKSTAFGVVSGSNGVFIENELESLGIQYDFIHTEGNTRTNLKVMDQDHAITELNEIGPKLSKGDLNAVTNKLIHHLQKGDILIISGSMPNKEYYYYDLINKVKEKEVEVILDADGNLFEQAIKATPSIIKPNRFELCQYFNRSEQISYQDIVLLSRQFIKQGVKLVVVSMGEEGALFINEQEAFYAKALPVQVYSSVGAGDAMVAAIAYALQKQYSLSSLIRIVMASSAAVIEGNSNKKVEIARIEQLEKQVNIISIDV